MDSGLASAIDVVINPGTTPGADRVLADMDRIIARGRQTSAANDNVGSSAERMGRSLSRAGSEGGALSRVLDDVRGRAAGATPAVGGLVNSLMGLGPMAMIAGGVALAIGAIGAASISAASKQQQWMAQLETMTGSSQKAQESYAALVNFANKTPFDLGQSVEGFTKLRSLGIEATEKRLTSFGNTSAAMGKSLNQMIEAVADAATGEFERLKEFGIKSKTEGDKVTFTFQGIKTTVGKNSKEITEYLEKIGDTKFAGAMAKQMDTLKGAFSNVEDNLFQMLAAFGSGQLGSAVKEIAKTVASGIGAITPLMASIGNAIGGIISGVGSMVNGFASAWSGINTGGTGVMPILDGITIGFNLIGQGAQVMGSLIGSVLGGVGSLASSVAEMFRSSFGGMLGDLGIGFAEGGRSWSNSIVGILRAVKFVVGQMPNMFKVAVSDIMKMFRDMGAGIMAFLSGDWKTGVALFQKKQFVSTGKAATAIGRMGNAVYGDEKGAAAAISRLTGRSNVTPKLDSGVAPKELPGAKKDDKKSKAEELAKKIDDFWKKLEGDSKDAEATYEALSKAATEGKNLSTASADTAKALEFQRLVSRDITDKERERIANALQTQRTSKFLGDALLAAETRKYDLAEAQAVLDKRKQGLTESQLDVEKGVIKFRSDAQQQGVDLQSAAYKLAEDKLRVDLASGRAIEDQNKALDDQKAKYQALVDAGKSVLDKYSPQAGYAKQMADFRDERSQLDAFYLANKDKGGPDLQRQYEAAVKGIAQAAADATTEFKTRWIDAIDELAQNFGGKLGTALQGVAASLQRMRQQGSANDGSLFGGIAGLFGKGTKDAYDAQGRANAGGLATALGNPLASLDKGFGEFKDLFKGTGPGSFSANLGKGLAKAGAGAEMGAAADGVMKALGIKSSRTGAQLGGAVGNLVGGPIGGIIGSIGGGLLGGLFKKTKSGAVTVSGGAASDIALSGNSGSLKKEASGLASSLQNRLADIASQLGASVGNFAGLTIGKYGESYKVNTTGASTLKKGKAGVVDFDEDADAALSFAIKTAISRGAIQGLGDFAQKAVNALDIDSAISLVKDFKSVMADFDAITDPVTAAVKAVTVSLDTLREGMVKVGASSTDLTKLDEYRATKLKAVLKEQVSGFQDILNQLNGDAGGFSDYAQLQNKLKEYDAYKSDLAAGKQVDQSAYTSLVNDILTKRDASFGVNSKEFQDITTMLRDTTTTAIGVTTNAFNAAGGQAAVVTAVQAQTDAYVAQQQVTNELMTTNNELLGQVLAELRASGGSSLRVQNASVYLQ